MAYTFDDDWDNRGSNPHWNSGLKTIPKSSAIRRSRSEPRTLNEKLVEPVSRKRYVHTDSWSSGNKVLHPTDRDERLSKDSKAITKQIASHNNHGSTQDWEYTGTLHKTLEKERPAVPKETWMSENRKIVREDGTEPKYVQERIYEYNQSPHRLETETIPTQYWDATHKVVPANRARKYLSNNQYDYTFRDHGILRDTHRPGDGSWATENFKIVGERRFVPGPRVDEWEGGMKTVPEENKFAQSHKFRDDLPVQETPTWYDQNLKVLTGDDYSDDYYRGSSARHYGRPARHVSEQKAKPGHKYEHVGTGWDSGLYKTLENKNRGEPLQYSLNNDWFSVKKKAFSREEQAATKKRIEVHGTGWDSGLKVLEPQSARVNRDKYAQHRTSDWARDGAKTLNWDESMPYGHSSEGVRHVMKPRHMDMMQFHKKLCGHE
uniref:Uncharacterized protein n=1 Tax=Eutreptiella gymnastica TaxID=73025 RepID=A0A6U8KXR1_9EUGL|mmetsp:Transcript_73866/g.130271  ORF Transcript_73866/g.130271 Transcript_73866/m.130271 type:complete len:434 (+) Transcript_73866:101-1402(+)